MKYKIYSFFIILFLGNYNNVQAADFNDFNDFDSFLNNNSKNDLDEFDDLDSLTTIANNLTPDQINIMKSCDAGKAAILSGYLSAIGIPTLFDAPFYFNTSIPITRNLINYPNFFLFSFKNPTKQQLTFYPFYNETHKKNFVKDDSLTDPDYMKLIRNGKRIGSYLNIENPELVKILDNTIDFGVDVLGLPELSDLNPRALLEIIGNAYLEERRLGMMMHYYKQINSKTIFEVRMPIIWMLRNLNFSQNDGDYLDGQARIVNNVLTGASTTPCAFDETKFGKQHLIMDALGFGTMDISLMRQIYDSQTADVYAGFSLYIPTDGHLAQGLYGTYFNPHNCSPDLPLCDLVNQDITGLVPGAGSIIESYFLKALNKLSSIILQCPLGYNRHFAFSFKVLPYWQIIPNLTYSGLYIFEYITPLEEQRFFNFKQPKTLFSETFNSLSSDPQAQITLLEAKLTSELFPRTYTAKVSPGFIFNSITNLQWSYKNWNFIGGYNYWYKSGEKISMIQAPKDILYNLNLTNCFARSASQVKLYAKVQKFIESSHKTISLSLFGDYTIWSNNIGDDFTFGFSFDKKF